MIAAVVAVLGLLVNIGQLTLLVQACLWFVWGQPMVAAGTFFIGGIFYRQLLFVPVVLLVAFVATTHSAEERHWAGGGIAVLVQLIGAMAGAIVLSYAGNAIRRLIQQMTPRT